MAAGACEALFVGGLLVAACEAVPAASRSAVAARTLTLRLLQQVGRRAGVVLGGGEIFLLGV